jgi:membrane-associated phospholipid phosphatase
MFYPFSIIAFYFLYKIDEKAFYKGIIATIIGCIICYIIYLLIPTIMYRPEIPSYDPFTNLVLKITFYFDDPPLNCFPSLHCVFCFQVMFSYLRSNSTIKKKILVSIIAIVIVLSTLFVKQHYIFDAVSAFLVCILAMMIESLFQIYDNLKKKIL